MHAYPLPLLDKSIEMSPIFGDLLAGPPHVFDFSSASKVRGYDTTDFQKFQKAVFGELHESGRSWGIGRYLEERSNLLKAYPQMIREGRVYHAGLDIVVPEDTAVFAPLDAVVHETGFDEGLGNYGGFLILKQSLSDAEFYTIFGHLKQPHMVTKGRSIRAGEQIARIGAQSDSGGWFTHLHLQVLTGQALDEGRMLQGYISREDVLKIEAIFPSPYFLFRY